MIRTILLLLLILVLVACEEETGTEADVADIPTIAAPSGSDVEIGTVVRVVDGDTIEVRIDGTVYDVRYVGMNTPERDQSCYSDATRANAELVEGRTVRLVRDTSNTDPYDRLLRYVVVGETFVNAELVRHGYAEVVSYPPDTRYFEDFRNLERQAASANLGCHPTGIFDDDSDRR